MADAVECKIQILKDVVRYEKKLSYLCCVSQSY